MLQDGKIYVGTSIKPQDPDAASADGETIAVETIKGEYLNLGLANRHGLITGATGTGKTVTMQVLAEGFSDAGVPVFAADIKGDLSGVSKPGSMNGFIERRNAAIGLSDYENRGYPTVFWDLFGKQGHPIRATVADMGPLLLARLLDLNETQEGVLTILFRVAADDNIPLVDLKDLRAMLNEIAE
ncbi:MAG: helicase HerA-like domain-containing protein, partial [Pseudomonadota bacterium]